MFSHYKIKVPDFNRAPVHTQNVFAWYWFFLRPYWKLFVFLTLNRGGRMVFFMGMEPLIVAKIIGAFEDGTAFENPKIVWLYVAFLAVTSSILFVLLLICTEESKLHERISRNARLAGLAHLNRLSARWHEHSSSGGKLQKIMNGSKAVQDMLRTWFHYILKFFASFIGVSVALYAMSAPAQYYMFFALMMLSFMAFAGWSSLYVERGYDQRNILLESLMGKVYEFVNATLTVKIFNLGEHILAHAQKGEQEGYEQAGRVYLIDYLRWVALNFIGMFWVVLIFYFAINQTLDKTLSIAAFALIAYQTLNLWALLEDFTSIYSQIVEQKSAFRRLVELLCQPVQITDVDKDKKLTVETGEISFNNISFSYNKQNDVFHGLSLKITAGEKVGVVGQSGSGKTTLVKLLLRFYDPSNNEITIDRQNIRLVSQESLRQNIAVIPQDVNLFNHSIMDNIRYGRLDATDEEVIQAAQMANADAFIRKLPEGYETLVGEHGAKLSGGQRQRIAIARAILKDAPILILDEATSALDSESEQLIQASLSRLMHNKTVIAVAHRLSTIASMDRILVFADGKCVEEGSHEELLARKGAYAKLWRLQSGNIIDE